MTYSAWLAMLPTGLPMLVVIGAFLAFGTALVLVLRAFVHHSVLQRHNEIAGFVFATVGVVYAVLLAFVVFAVWEQHSEALDVSESEAMHAISLYRNLSAYPNQVQAEPAVAALATFARSVVEEEYPALWRHHWDGPTQVSARADERFGLLRNAVRGVIPQTMQEQSLFQELLQDVDSMEEQRSKRLLMARQDVPRVIWLAILVGGLVTVGYPALFGHENVLSILVLAWLLAVVVGLVVLVVVRLDYPFLGPDRIEPDGYDLLIRLAKW